VGEIPGDPDTITMLKAQVAMQDSRAVIKAGKQPENGGCAGQLVESVLDGARLIVRDRERMVAGS
jgi:hypothetical protein